MKADPVELDPDLADLLESWDAPRGKQLRRSRVRGAGGTGVRELIVLGLYGQGELSSGKAAELLGQQRGDFHSDPEIMGGT